jgi:hypothetical protein
MTAPPFAPQTGPGIVLSILLLAAYIVGAAILMDWLR